MIVEFVGPPGVGKTTIATEMVEMMPDAADLPRSRLTRLSTKRRQIEKLRIGLRQLINHPYDSLDTYATVSRTGETSTPSERFRIWLNWTVMSHLYREGANDHDIRLFDQGLTQAYASVLLGGPTAYSPPFEQQLRSSFDCNRYTIIHLDAADAVLSRRLAGRSGARTRVRQHEHPYTLDDHRTAIQTAVDRVETVVRSADVQILHHRTDDSSPDDVAASLLTEIDATAVAPA